MEFVDVNGVNLRPGQRVAWATVGRGGVLATGLVLSCGPYSEVRVRLDSNGRVISLPYREDKFVVMSYDHTKDPEYAATCLCPACQGVYNSKEG